MELYGAIESKSPANRQQCKHTRHKKEIQVEDMHWGTSYRVTHQAVAREEGIVVGGMEVEGEGLSRVKAKSYKRSPALPSTRIRRAREIRAIELLI